MKARIKTFSAGYVTFMIFIIGLIIGNLNGIIVEAKQVGMKTQVNPQVKVAFLNDGIDENVKELVFRIKNKSDTEIKIKKIMFQIEQTDGWITYDKKKDVDFKCSIKVGKGKKIYDSILLDRYYNIPKSGLRSGSYRVLIKYKYKGKSYYAKASFLIEREDENLEPSDDLTFPTDNAAPPAATVPAEEAPAPPQSVDIAAAAATTGQAVKGGNVTGNYNAVQMLNFDFTVDQKGNCQTMIFSEAEYARTDKVKIIVKIQKKKGKKWKKYRKYKVIKKSNVAFANKTFKIKKTGTYRMSAEITFYKGGVEQGKYRVKTKKKILKGSR